MKAKQNFAQRHPLFFGLIILTLAVPLALGGSAFVRNFDILATGPERLGVVYIEDVLFDVSDYIDFIHELREDPTIKGVLLRVNSPGGAIAPSQELYQAVCKLRKAKPVVASYDSVAASGGYYASCPADIIVANAGSITGSIGVLMQYVNVHELAKHWGVRLELLTSGSQKGAGSPLRELTPEQRQAFMDMLMDMHEQFITDVAQARKMEKSAVQALADGRAYTGKQALALGLVDVLGSFEDAYDILATRCGVSAQGERVEGPEKEVPLIEQLLGETRLNQFVRSLSSGVRFLYQ